MARLYMKTLSGLASTLMQQALANERTSPLAA